MYIDLATTQHPRRDLHQLFLSFIQPRPIAFVSTISADGKLNLAPFSFYNMVSSNPPVVIFSPGLNRNSGKKDTLVNILETKEYVIATVTEPITERMNICSVDFPHGINEFEKSGLTPIPATKVRAPLVKESPVNIECRLRQVVSLGDNPGAGQVIFGDILALHIDESVLIPGELFCDPNKLQAIARMGRDHYGRSVHPFSLESIRDPDEFAKRGPAKIKD